MAILTFINDETDEVIDEIEISDELMLKLENSAKTEGVSIETFIKSSLMKALDED